MDVETPARKEPRILEKHGHSKELRAVSTPQTLGFLLLGQACFEFLLVKMAGWLPSRIVIGDLPRVLRHFPQVSLVVSSGQIRNLPGIFRVKVGWPDS